MREQAIGHPGQPAGASVKPALSRARRRYIMSLPAPRVVAAVSSCIRPRILAVLAGCELCFVSTGTELVRALHAAPCGLLMVEVHFDESAAAAALRCALACDASIPVVCVRDVPGAKPAYAALNALRMAFGSVGARDFIELWEHPDDMAGNARVRARLEPHLQAISVS